MRKWAVAIVLVAGCSAEPAWQEGQIGEIYEGLTVGGAGGCSTFILDGLSKQLIAEQNCIRANALVSFAGKKGISIGSNVYAYLEPKAAAGLEAAGQAATLDVSSAFRTVAQQYLLYHWYQTGQCGISLAAVPGNSNHETGIAVDLSNYGSVIATMEAHGWSHSYPSSDPVHFDYTAGGTVDLRSESVLAFQKLWNLNNPGDKIAEDGAYGPQTEARIKASPATGFAKGSTCASTPAPTPPPPSPPKFAAKLMGASFPTTLQAGESAAAWVEYENTGTETWTPAETHLGTIDPRDRDSALAAPDWLGPNRPTGVDADTKPGEVGRFSFFVKAPTEEATTALTEKFELVEEGVTWFGADSDVTAELEIDPPAGPDTTGTSGDVGAGGQGSGAGVPSMHGGCSAAPGAPGGAPGVIAIMLLGGSLCLWRRSSYSKRRCSASARSSSFSPSR